MHEGVSCADEYSLGASHVGICFTLSVSLSITGLACIFTVTINRWSLIDGQLTGADHTGH